MRWSKSVDEALCFGWIDGRRKRIGDDTYSIRLTPRKPSSIWSVVNNVKMGKVRNEGTMQLVGEDAFALRPEAKSGVHAHERSNIPELDVPRSRAI